MSSAWDMACQNLVLSWFSGWFIGSLSVACLLVPLSEPCPQSVSNSWNLPQLSTWTQEWTDQLLMVKGQDNCDHLSILSICPVFLNTISQEYHEGTFSNLAQKDSRVNKLNFGGQRCRSLCTSYVFHSHQCYVSETPGRNFITSQTNVHLDSSINLLEYEPGQTCMWTITSLLGGDKQLQCSNSG